MEIKVGGAFKQIIAFVRVAGAWVEANAFTRVPSVGWKGRLLNTTKTSVGTATGTYSVVAQVEWTPPAGDGIVKLSCTADVYQHVPIEENQANMTSEIQGWNGTSWVTLVKHIGDVCTDQGQTLVQTLTYTFDPINSVYSKFRFYNGGNSFTRHVTGYKEKWYSDTVLPI